MLDHAMRILKDVFGYDAFRGNQAAIIERVAGGGDALVLMPTGGGKSLCYQLPALMREGVTVVISPLIALMRDQVRSLREAGVAVTPGLDFDTGRGHGTLRFSYAAATAEIAEGLRRLRAWAAAQPR